MPYVSLVDLLLDEFGDLAVDANGDLAEGDGVEVLLDDCRVRLLSQSPEMADCDGVLANLEDLMGRPNRPDTADEMVRLIVSALSSDGRLDADQIDVTPLPVQNALYAHIEITLEESSVEVLMTLDLATGLVNLQMI
jgi:hypothetical protein